MSRNGGLSYEQLSKQVELLQQQVVSLTAEKRLLEVQKEMIEEVELITQSYLKDEELKSTNAKIIGNLVRIINASSDEKNLEHSLQS